MKNGADFNKAEGFRLHHRGYVPHLESSHAIQHVAFHLADSLPKDVVERLEQEMELFPSDQRQTGSRKSVEDLLDGGRGSCLMREPEIAQLVQDSILFFDSQRYRLLAWVVMPNHVHVLMETMKGWEIGKIVGSWKKFTATRIIALIKSRRSHKGPIWAREYWDRYMRDGEHLLKTIKYIEENPVKAGMANTPEEWKWGSAYYWRNNKRPFGLEEMNGEE